jgi:hypothetical protein
MVLDIRTIQIIEKQWMDKIVELAREAIEVTGIHGCHCQKHGWFHSPNNKCPTCGQRRPKVLQKAQLSNLQNFANVTESLRALELFIVYQMERKEGQGWKYSRGDIPFGNLLLLHFNKLGDWSRQINPSDSTAVHLWLIRLYTGFLTRWFVALAGGAEEADEEAES